MAEGRTLRFLSEARHGCLACGRCCGGYAIGPLAESEAARIRELDLGAAGAGLEGIERVRTSNRGGIEVREIAKRDGVCIFLERSGTCLLHRVGGSAAKPAVCRLFPVRFAIAPDGDLIGFLQMECFRYDEARRRGPPLCERTEEVRSLLAIASPSLRRIPERIRIGAAREMSFAEYLEKEAEILAAIQESDAPFEGILWAVGSELARHARGGGETGVGADPPERNDRLLGPILALSESLAEGAGLVAGAREDACAARIARAFAEIASAYAGGGDARDREAIDALPPADGDPTCREILRESLRNEIFSKKWIRGGDLGRGVALGLVRQLLAAAGSQIIAARRGAGRVAPPDLAEAIATVNRGFRILRAEEAMEGIAGILDAIFEALAGGGGR